MLVLRPRGDQTFGWTIGREEDHDFNVGVHCVDNDKLIKGIRVTRPWNEHVKELPGGR